MNVRDKIEFIVALISEFSAHYKLSDNQTVRYLKRYGALELCDKHYDFLHTQSFESCIRELADFCRRRGGKL